MIDAQRSHAASDLKPVGMILETVISADGVTRDVVHAWPEDFVGEAFRPRTQAPLQEKSRAERRRQKRGGPAEHTTNPP